MPLKKSDINKAFQEGESLIDWLPWADYEDGIFVQVDGSVGKIWELQQIPVDLKSPESLEGVSESIENLLVRLPEEIACQLILLCDNKIENLCEQYSQLGNQDFAYSKISIKGKLEHLLEKEKALFQHKNISYTPRRIRVFFTLRYFPEVIKITLKDKLTTYLGKHNLIKEKFEKHYEKNIKPAIKRFSDITEESMKSSGIAYSSIDASGLLKFVYPLLNLKRSQKIPAPGYNEEVDIRKQTAFEFPVATGEGFVFDDIKTKIVSLKELPLQTFPGMFSAETGERAPLLDLVRNFVMVMNIYIPEQQREMSQVKAKKTFAFLHRANILGDTSVESGIMKEETDNVIKKIFERGKKVIKCQIHFITWGTNENKLQQNVDNIINSLHFIRCEGIEEKIIGHVLYLQCLPLNFSPYEPQERFVGRASRFVSDNLADMLPLYGTYKGTRTPAQLYLNRRGEIVFFDFFDSNTAPHGIIAGVTGAGKSYFTNDLIMQNLRLGGQFFILDKGGSYKKICNLNGGQYINIEPDSPICINPFVEKELTNERKSFLVSLLCEMASGGEEEERLNREERTFVLRGISNAYEQHRGEKQVSLTEVVKEIEKQKGGESIATKLAPFVKGGPYAGFFDGQNEFNLKSEFTVFELGALSTSKDLQIVILMDIMYFLTNKVSSPDLREKRKFLLIDEAWSLLNTENTAKFLEGAFRTFRKYGTSAIAITQQTGDLTRTTAGEACRANAPNRIFLKQSPEVVVKMKKDLDLTDSDIKVLKTLDTIKGKFSEALIKTDSGGGVIRLVADPTNYWLFTTDPRDEKFLNEKIKECNGNIEEAIKLAKKENPYGIQ